MIETFIRCFDCAKTSTLNPMESMKLDFHLHDLYEIYLFQSGGVRYFIEKSSYELEPGDILLMRPGEIHKPSFTSNETYERIVCHLPPKLFHELSTKENSLLQCYTNRLNGEKNRLNSTDDEKNKLVALFEKIILIQKYPQLWNPQLLLAIFLEIMVKINRIFLNETRNPPSQILNRKLVPILDYIDANLDSNLSLDFLQKKFFITGSYLCQIFKQTTGSTLHEYIVYKRITRAKHLLLKGESAANASFKSGFSDYSNFVRAFRKVTGICPRDYLKKFIS